MDTIKSVINKTNGKFFTCTFERSSDTKSGKRGEVVSRVFRVGVKKHLKGVGMNYVPEDKGLITLWCHTGYRTIKVDNVISVKCGKTIVFKR